MLIKYKIGNLTKGLKNVIYFNIDSNDIIRYLRLGSPDETIDYIDKLFQQFMLFINKEQKLILVNKIKYLCKTLQVLESKSVLLHLDKLIE